MHKLWNISVVSIILCILLIQPVAANDIKINKIVTSSINLQIVAQYIIDGHVTSSVIETVSGAGGDLAIKRSITSHNSGMKNILFIQNSPYTINRIFNKEVSFDRDRDTIILPPIIVVPFAMVSAKFKTIKEIQEYSKTNNVFVGSTGSLTNIMNKVFVDKMGIKSHNIVYYKSHSDMSMSVIRGDIDYTFVVAGPPIADLQTPKINVLGVSGHSRLLTNPDVPLFTEIGLKEMNIAGYSFFATPNIKNPSEHLDMITSIFKDKKNIEYLRKQNLSILDINTIDDANYFIKTHISDKYNNILRELEK